MVKAITEITSEQELQEYLEDQKVNLTEIKQEITDDLTNIKYEHEANIFYVDSVDDLKDMDIQSIYYYIQAIQIMATDVDTEANRRLEHLLRRIDSRLHNIPEVWDAMQIQKHWKVFNEHLDANPTLREEWDALCMGIKLTETSEYE